MWCGRSEGVWVTVDSGDVDRVFKEGGGESPLRGLVLCVNEGSGVD